MYKFFHEEAYLYVIDCDGIMPCNQDAQDPDPFTDSVDAIVSNAIFNQLQGRFICDWPGISFGADIYRELEAFITEHVME